MLRSGLGGPRLYRPIAPGLQVTGMLPRYTSKDTRLEQRRAEAQCFWPRQLGIGLLQCFSYAKRRQEYAVHIRTLALDS
jgi:hypothetical protein